MLNAFLAILIVPFFPVFMYNSLTADLAYSNEIGDQGQVLGEESQRDMNDYQKDVSQNFVSKEMIDSRESESLNPIPQRKDNYYDIKIWATSTVAIDADTGTILEYENGRKQTQVASLTKIMTAVLVMENIEDLNENVVITREALSVDGTTIGCPTSTFCNANRMYVGEKISALNLLKATLLNSANDAATALAIHVAGTPEAFVKKMNDKAKSLGLKDTNFCTPSGLEIDGREWECYASAYDIARITAYSLQYDLIWDIMGVEEEQIFSADGKYMHQLKNTDILLSEMPNCLGGKTGFTPMAGKSLLTVTVDPTGKHKVISVILNNPNRWEDMKRLVDWVFSNYQWS